MPGPIDLSGMVPPEHSNQIIAEAVQSSAALTLGRRLPMGRAISELPVAGAFPTAAWTGPNGRKPYTDLALSSETLKAEEVAAVVSVPDRYFEDSTINIWAYARPLLAEAIGAALDDATIWGLNAPASFPAGGVVGAATRTATGSDAADTVNHAMGAVEAQGLNVTGSAADIAVKASLRGVRDQTGALLLGTEQTATRQINTLYGSPISYVSFPVDSDEDFITGDWQYLVIGVRQDIRFQLSRDGVIVDDDGRVVVSGFQDNQTLLKVWARFGAAIVKPVTRRAPAGANPFAVTTVGALATPPGTAVDEAGE